MCLNELKPNSKVEVTFGVWENGQAKGLHEGIKLIAMYYFKTKKLKIDKLTNSIIICYKMLNTI